MSASRTRFRVVVDGSNFATEGRTTPSLVQLDEAVRAFLEENPTAEIIVVADASFEHRVAPGERARFKEAELAGEIVTPPAGAVGRGDAFILKIADRIDGVVLSNDSFQEFHDQYQWLFDVGRLIGGKPVPGVGWVFTPRLPVRGAKSVRATKKLSVALPNGAVPTIGTTLTPIKSVRATKKAPAKELPAKETPAVDAPAKEIPAKSAKAPAKPTKRASKAIVGPPPSSGETALKAVADRSTRPSSESAAKTSDVTSKKALKALKPIVKKSPAKVAKAPAKPAKRALKVALEVPATIEVPTPAVALRRGRQPVNPEAEFTMFRNAHRIGARVEGEVSTFTSHGAVIKVTLKGGQHIECYAPTTLLGTPAPARARDVLKRGDRKSFRLVNVDSERRIAELALL